MNKNYCPFSPGAYGTKIDSQWAVVAPFYADLILSPISDASNSKAHLFTGLYLRGTTDSSIIDRATNDVKTYMNISQFYTIWVFVATWYNARAWGFKEVGFNDLPFKFLSATVGK